MGEDHQVRICGFGGRGFDTHGSLLLRFPCILFWGCSGFMLWFLRPVLLPGGGNCKLLRSLLDRMMMRISMWVRGWSHGGLDNTPPSDDLFPPLAQVHLLGRGTVPLGFRSGRLACGDALSAALGRLLRKSYLRLLPLYTATVVRCVLFATATAFGLFQRGRVATGDVETPQERHRRAYPLLRCVWPKRWQRLHCIGPFGASYDSTDTR